MNNYRMMANGMFFAASETLFVKVPCRVFSVTGNWYADCDTMHDLYHALKKHHGEPASVFNLADVLQWAQETATDRSYCGRLILSKHKKTAQGVLDEGFL